MINLKNIIFVLVLSAALLIPGSAQTEEFESLEYGFSVEYPRELEIDLLTLDLTAGVEDVVVEFIAPGVMTIYVGASERRGLSLDRFASRTESDYEESGDRFEVMNTEKRIFNGVETLEKEYLLEDETGIYLMKDVFLKGDDLVYHISCRAVQSEYRRADILYFNGFIDSFRAVPIDETVTGDWIQTAKPIWSSPALADIDGDGELEIVIGTNEGKLYVFNQDGSRMAGFPTTAEDGIRSSPAVTDLDGDGSLDIVVGSDDDRLYAWDGKGNLLPGFPKLTSNDVASSPAIGDLDGDGSLEIVVGSNDRGIYALHGDGSPVCGFPLITANPVWSSPAIADLNGDGDLEMVVGSKWLGEDIIAMFLGSYTGQVYAADCRGYPLLGFPVDLSSPSLSDLEGSSIGYSSPILADLNGDGDFEIIIGALDGLYVLTREGEDLMRFPRKTSGSLQDSFIAVGDIDGDGSLEIVAGGTDGRLYLWRNDGSDYPGFPIQTGGYVKHIALGDIDDDGEQEIIGGSSDNRVHAWKLDGTEVSGFPKVTLGNVDTTPSLGDLDGDGTLEMVAGSDDARIYIWEVSDSFGDLDWPMIRQNLRHTGTVPL
jgi:hypothetical protein